MDPFESILRRIVRTPTEEYPKIFRREVAGRGAQKRSNGAVYLFPLTISELVKKWGDGLAPWILRRIAHEKTESYREYGAGFFEGEAAGRVSEAKFIEKHHPPRSLWRIGTTAPSFHCAASD